MLYGKMYFLEGKLLIGVVAYRHKLCSWGLFPNKLDFAYVVR